MAQKLPTITASENGTVAIPAGFVPYLPYVDWLEDRSSGPPHQVVRYKGDHIPSTGQIAVMLRLTFDVVDLLKYLSADRDIDRMLGAILSAAKDIELSEDSLFIAHRGRPGVSEKQSLARIYQIQYAPGLEGGKLQLVRDEYLDKRFDLVPEEIAILEALAKRYEHSPSAIVEVLVKRFWRETVLPTVTAALPAPVEAVPPASRGRYGTKTYKRK